jgi:hypothetical protein
MAVLRSWQEILPALEERDVTIFIRQDRLALDLLSLGNFLPSHQFSVDLLPSPAHSLPKDMTFDMGHRFIPLHVTAANANLPPRREALKAYVVEANKVDDWLPNTVTSFSTAAAPILGLEQSISGGVFCELAFLGQWPPALTIRLLNSIHGAAFSGDLYRVPAPSLDVFFGALPLTEYFGIVASCPDGSLIIETVGSSPRLTLPSILETALAPLYFQARPAAAGGVIEFSDIHLPLAAALLFILQPAGFRMNPVEEWPSHAFATYAPLVPSPPFQGVIALVGGAANPVQFRALEPLVGPSLVSEAQVKGAASYVAAIELLRELIADPKVSPPTDPTVSVETEEPDHFPTPFDSNPTPDFIISFDPVPAISPAPLCPVTTRTVEFNKVTLSIISLAWGRDIAFGLFLCGTLVPSSPSDRIDPQGLWTAIFCRLRGFPKPLFDRYWVEILQCSVIIGPPRLLSSPPPLSPRKGDCLVLGDKEVRVFHVGGSWVFVEDDERNRARIQGFRPFSITPSSVLRQWNFYHHCKIAPPSDWPDPDYEVTPLCVPITFPNLPPVASGLGNFLTNKIPSFSTSLSLPPRLWSPTSASKEPTYLSIRHRSCPKIDTLPLPPINPAGSTTNNKTTFFRSMMLSTRNPAVQISSPPHFYKSVGWKN